MTLPSIRSKAHINIDLRNVLEIALLGVRRAAMFIGLGVNAAENPAMVDYQIHGFKEFHLLPLRMAQDAIEESKKDFRQWIIGNGLTELLHQYSLFLDELYAVGLFAKSVQKSDDIEAVKPLLSSFRSKTSIASKLRVVHKELGLESQFRGNF